MRRTLGIMTGLLATAIVLAGCGAGAGGGTASAGSPSVAASAQASSEPSAPASQPAASAAASTGGGGGDTADACALLTTEEVAEVIGVTGVTSSLTPGDISSCIYMAGDSVAAGTSYTTKDVDMVFGIYEGEEGATVVPGIGDKAVFSPSTEVLFIRKGGAMAGIAAGRGADGTEQRLEWATALGKIAVARM